MDGLAVKRYGCEGCSNRHHYLSIVCPEHLSVCRNLKLPFDNEPAGCSSCGGLLYFQGDKGTSAVCNLTTKQMKVLPPPTFEPPPHLGTLSAGCLGYDATSKDYKVIRNIKQFYEGEDEDGFVTYLGCKSSFELYSLKRGSWREILTPATHAASIIDSLGVYLAETGSCYWRAVLDPSFGGVRGDPHRDHVLSFDFARESFGHLPLPDPTTAIGKIDDLDIGYKLVECSGSLGTLVYWNPDHNMPASPLSVELFVWKGMSWVFLYAVSLAHVERPLGLRDDHLLFLEAQYSSRIGQLMVYDLQTGESEKLNIYDCLGIMTLHSYARSTAPLPDSEPITMNPHVESTDPLPITSEDDDEDVEKRKTRIRMRRGRKRKATRTVSKNKPHSRKRRRLTSSQ